MINLRQGKTKSILESSINSALAAVGLYNTPNNKFRVENYIILMIIAWTKLFHSYFQNKIGSRYFYKEMNGRYKKVDGEKKAWDLKECIKHYQKNAQKKLSEATVQNLHFFVEIRNKIEHRYWNTSSLDIFIFGECQSLLYNYENLLTSLFGEDYSINACLAYSLQFSQLRSNKQLVAQRDLLSNEMQDIKKYIEKYRIDLSQEVYDSQEYSIKLIQIPKISNTNRSELSVEFVEWNSLNNDDKENYQKILGIIKDKIIKQPISNINMLKPSDVIKEVEKLTKIKLNQSNHTDLWKAFEVRPAKDSKSKFNTKSKYCIYDEPHNDYLYTKSWVDLIVRLVTTYGFNTKNIHNKCKEKLQIQQFEN